MTSNVNNLKLCRLCMSEESLESIFQHQELNMWILNFLSITVTEDDTISLSICVGCRTRLREFREYQLHCFQVQDILVRESVSIKEEIIPEDEPGGVPTAEEREIETSHSTLATRSDSIHCTGDVSEPTQVSSRNEAVLGKLPELISDPAERKSNQFEGENATVPFEPIEIKQKILPLDDSKDAHLSTDDVQKAAAEESQLPPTDASVIENLPQIDDSAQSVRAKRKNYMKRANCTTCGRSIRVVLLEGHQNKHLGLRPFKCELGCEKADFHCRQSRNLHYRVIHRIDEKECHICHKKYRNKTYLDIHLKIVHCSKIFECPICNSKHKTVGRLNRHMKTHGQREILRCPHCNGIFYTKTGLENHIKKHHRDDDASTAETATNSRNKKYIPRDTCPICHKPISTVRMEEHLEWHDGFKCKRGCKNLSFESRKEERQHYRTVHNPKVTGRYECDVCFKVVKYKGNLRIHKKWVHGPKKFKCSDCNAAFHSKGNLTKHINVVHKWGKTYCCTICDKAFSREGYLRVHMKVHGDKLPNKTQSAALEVLFEAEEVKIEAREESDDIGDTA